MMINGHVTQIHPIPKDTRSDVSQPDPMPEFLAVPIISMARKAYNFHLITQLTNSDLDFWRLGRLGEMGIPREKGRKRGSKNRTRICFTFWWVLNSPETLLTHLNSGTPSIFGPTRKGRKYWDTASGKGSLLP